jgi:hypothetical protein
MHYISIFSTIIALFFAGAVFLRYSKRGGIHLLLWGIGLIFYAIGTFSESVLLFHFDPWFLKAWYLSGAMLTAAWLGQGSIHLLVRKRGVASKLTALLAAVSLLAAFLVFTAPVTAAAGSYNVSLPATSQYRDILVRSSLITILTIVLNIYGTIALVGGALYSSFLFWRKHVLANRMVGNILIAAGALMPAMGGSFLKAGLTDWHYLSTFLGAVIMFIGFLTATAAQKVDQKATAATS